MALALAFNMNKYFLSTLIFAVHLCSLHNVNKMILNCLSVASA